MFLSYGRADQARATALVRALEAHGLDVWWDALIEGGAVFANSIEAALRSCDAVVVLWSRQSVGSDWVRDEAAKGRDQRKLVPLSLDGVEPPLGFGQYHAIDFSRWRGTADDAEVHALLRALATATGAAQGPRSSPLASASSVALSRRRLVQFAGASAVAAVAAVGGVLAWRGGLLKPIVAGLGFAQAANSVAVLPFQNLSGDPQQAYFSSGVAEEVRATLARSNRFRVMAETSSSAFRERSESAVSIASKLNVAYLLAGSVRRAGDVVRIAADLIDGATGFSRWSQSFDRRLIDVFAVQTEIANAVAQALLNEVNGPRARAGEPVGALAVAPGLTTSVEAYDAYLHGRALSKQGGGEATERAALQTFNAAIAADPDFAAAHAARSRALTTLAFMYTEPGALSGVVEAALSAAQRAIAIAPEMADGHSVLGLVLFQGRLDARAARAPFERSLELGAGDASILGRYALYSARAGRGTAALSPVRLAVTLDPLNALIHGAEGVVHYLARRYEQAIPPMHEALRLQPKAPQAHAVIGNALLMLGRLEQARLAYMSEPARIIRLTGTAVVEWRLRSKLRARTAMAALVQEFGDSGLYQQAQVLAQWNETSAALAKLESARVVGDPGLVHARTDPLLDPLRNSPRFAVLLKSLGFD